MKYYAFACSLAVDEPCGLAYLASPTKSAAASEAISDYRARHGLLPSRHVHVGLLHECESEAALTRWRARLDDLLGERQPPVPVAAHRSGVSSAPESPSGND